MLIPFPYLFDKYKIKSKGVLHLGANSGQEAEAYRQCGVERVIWVEALPELCEACRRHVAAYPNNIVLEACVSDVSGAKVKFHVASNGGQSSSFLEFGTHEQEHPSVYFTKTVEMQTVRVDDLLKRNKIELDGGDWFGNLDVQGSELLALRGMGQLLWKFGHIYVEVNTRPLYKGCPMVEDIDDYLVEFGFTGKETKMTNHSWGDKFYQRFALQSK